MSILIKDMEMPTSCKDCKLRYRHHGFTVIDYCFLSMKTIDPWTFGRSINGDKPDWCPLIEVPPHGRLIDADALMNDGWTLHKQVIRMGGYAIHEMPLDNPNVPTVIPADKESEA